MKESLEFYDIMEMGKFASTEWRIEEKTSGNRTRYFAVAPVPTDPGREAWRIISKDFATANN